MSMSGVLRQYIRDIIAEVEKNPRVGNQLSSTDRSKDEDGKKENGDNVDETSVAANIVGPMLPFGVKTPGKKKEPGWK
jgi:hypothetical protein